MDARRQTAALYHRFAEHEARGRSPLYQRVARCIAGDEAILGLLAEMPPAKRQPNLLLGAVRYLYGDARERGRVPRGRPRAR